MLGYPSVDPRLTQPDQVRGLPERAREALAAAARDAGVDEASADQGPWLQGSTCPATCRFLPMPRTACGDRLRAHVSRATEGELDNAPIEEILNLGSQARAGLRPLG